jgi:MFS transporter, UMF1 family
MGEPEVITPAGYTKREQRAWYFYDFANSAFSSTVVTLFLGPYLTSIARTAADARGYIYPLGVPVDARSYWGYLISLSVITQVLFLPILGAIADYSPRKKHLFAACAYLGAFATISMYFLDGGEYLFGGALFLIANLNFGASIVLYNSYLPQIASVEQRDDVSSKGWGIGYLGGGVLLALNLLLYQNAERLGLTGGEAVRISLASAGLWWALWAIIPMVRLRPHAPIHQRQAGRNYVAVGFEQLARTFRDMRHYPRTLTFVLAYLLYNDAIQAVITLASQFGNDELKIPLSTMTMVILMVQFVAFAGAFCFNWIAGAIGAKRSVMFALVIWTLVIVSIYGWVKTTAQFFMMAAIVGMVMGGSQALSRSLYSLMIPKGKEAEYFSLYEISDKGTSWMAPLIFGLALQFAHSYRLAILSLIAFFVLGLLVLSRVDVRRATIEAGHEVPGAV